MEALNIRNLDRWQQVKQNEVEYRQYYLEDAEIVVTGFGSTARVALSAVRMARAEGIKVGLIRPVILSPFPDRIYQEIAGVSRSLLVVETNAGQMVKDVLLAVQGRIPVEFYGRLGGVMPFADEILGEIRRLAVGSKEVTAGDPLQRWLARLKAQRV